MNDAFSPDRFRQAVLVQYQQSLERSERAAAQRYISSFMEREVRKPRARASTTDGLQ